MADTVRTITDLLTNLFQDGQAAGSITEQDVRDLIVSVQPIGGWADYNDNATATTPISITGGAGYTNLTNDGAGAFTQKRFKDPDVTDLWDTVNDEFDFSALDLYDTVDIRIDIEVTTTTANTDVEMALEMASGHANTYDLPLTLSSYKAAGTYQITKFSSIYIGDAVTQTNPAKIKVKADNNITVKVNGWYCRIGKY